MAFTRVHQFFCKIVAVGAYKHGEFLAISLDKAEAFDDVWYCGFLSKLLL